MKHIALIMILIIALTACSPGAEPTRTIERGEVIYTNTFDDPTSWETFGLLDTQFGIQDGVYNAISNGGGYIPVSNGVTHSNVVIEATTSLVSGSDDTIYGVMCRMQQANPSVGYYFLINGAGQYGIRIGEGSRLRVFVPWTDHSAVKTGQNSNNTLRVVCVDDYFAFYINDRFVAEATDNWLSEGTMGFALTGTSGTNNAVTFDDVTIWDAQLTDTE
ncbi:MAG: hypothetical protein AAFV93_08195 [Chloroflexota bacterium]